MMGQISDSRDSWSTELSPRRPLGAGGGAGGRVGSPEALITQGEGVSTIRITSDVQNSIDKTGELIAIKSTIPQAASENIVSYNGGKEVKEKEKEAETLQKEVAVTDSGDLDKEKVVWAASAVLTTKHGTEVPNGSLPRRIKMSDEAKTERLALKEPSLAVVKENMAPETPSSDDTTNAISDTTSAAISETASGAISDSTQNGMLPQTTETSLSEDAKQTETENKEDKSLKYRRKKVSWNEKVFVTRSDGTGSNSAEVVVEGLQAEDHEYNPYSDIEVYSQDPGESKSLTNGSISGRILKGESADRKDKIQTAKQENKIWVRKCCAIVLGVLLLFVVLALIALAAVFVWKFVPQPWSDEIQTIIGRLGLDPVSKSGVIDPFTAGWTADIRDRGRYYLITEEEQMKWQRPNTSALMIWHSGEPLQVTGWNPNLVNPYDDHIAGDPTKIKQGLYSVYLEEDRWYSIKIAQANKYTLFSILPLQGNIISWSPLPNSTVS